MLDSEYTDENIDTLIEGYAKAIRLGYSINTAYDQNRLRELRAEKERRWTENHISPDPATMTGPALTEKIWHYSRRIAESDDPAIIRLYERYRAPYLAERKRRRQGMSPMNVVSAGILSGDNRVPHVGKDLDITAGERVAVTAARIAPYHEVGKEMLDRKSWNPMETVDYTELVEDTNVSDTIVYPTTFNGTITFEISEVDNGVLELIFGKDTKVYKYTFVDKLKDLWKFIKDTFVSSKKK